MPTVARLAVSVTANTSKFTKGMDRSRRGLKGFSRDAKKATLVTRALSKALITAGGALGAFAIVRGITRAAKSVDNFNQAMRSSLAIMGDVSLAMRSKMERAAISVAKTTKFSGEEAAKAYFFLASAGLDAQQSIAAMPLVAKFAQAGMFDLAKATDLVTDAQSALGLTTKDARTNLSNMTRVADVLVKANTLANASVEQFSESLTSKAGAALKILNKDIEEGVAVLAAFADQGVKSSEAGTGLNIVLRDLTTKAIRNAAAFKEHNVRVFDMFGNMRNLADVIGDVERALKGQSDAVKKATLLQLGFADKSIIFIQTLLGMSDRIREYEAALRDAGGTTQDVADRQLTPLNKALQHLSGAWLELATNMEPAIGAVARFIEGLAKATGEVNKHIEATKPGWFAKGFKEVFIPPPPQKPMSMMDFLFSAPKRTPRFRDLIEDLTPGPVDPRARPLDEALMGPPAPIPNFARLLDSMMGPFRLLRAFGRGMFDEWNEKLDEFNKKVSSVAGVVQGLLQRAKTPAERFRDVLDAINISLAAGKITAEQYGRALRQARTELEQRLARLAPKAAAMPAVARTAEFQQVALSRVAIQGVTTPGRPQIVRDPQLVDTNMQLRLIKAALSVTRFGLTS